MTSVSLCICSYWSAAASQQPQAFGAIATAAVNTMLACSEFASLQIALRALQGAGVGAAPAARSSALRAVERAADDAEAAADEIGSVELRRAVADARAAAHDARGGARRAARDAAAGDRRAALLGEETIERGDDPSDAAKLAQDITASLRRSTAVIQEELARTTATGDVSEV
jgi:hypothetical protein